MIELNTNVLGVFALKNGRIIKKIFFSREPKKLASKLIEIEDSVCVEEKEVISYLQGTGTKEIRFRDPDRFSRYCGEIGLVEDKNPTQLFGIYSELGVSESEVMDLLHRVNLEITRVKMREIGKDQLIIQAIASLDDLDESINTLIKRLHEWHALNFPELGFIVKNPTLYLSIVSSGLGGVDAGLKEKIQEEKKQTLGIEFSEGDKEAVRVLSDSIRELYLARDRIEAYVGEAMQEAAPNMNALAGPLIGARLISLAGGLERLSILPASTIQILGAEDAFFRFLKTKKRPPKHGVIFQLPEIRSASKSVRGRISRVFAAKLALASRIDRFGGEFIGDKLRADFLAKIGKK